jgi:deferrochelatase/peroxidase EfeB
VSHTLVTIVAKIPAADVDEARRLAEALGNPASAPIRAAFESLVADTGDLAVHFSSLSVMPATGGGGHLVFEFSADGDQRALIDALADRVGPHVGPVFALAVDRGSESLAQFWTSHIVTVGQSLTGNPGVLFVGTPGLSVQRIRREEALRDRLTALVEESSDVQGSALRRLNGVRQRLEATAEWRWALTAEDAAALHAERTVGQSILPIARSVFRTYLWPVVVPAAVMFGLAFVEWRQLGHGLVSAFAGAGLVALRTLGFTLAVVTLLAGVAYLLFRRRENAEDGDDRHVDGAALARIVERENQAAQNHLAGVSVMKAGLLRQLAVRITFAAIAQLATHLYRPGWLGTLGTIHFARWVMVPGTRDLLFLSNYGGSWESYLEDFITKSHDGLTAVWSNTVGFPKAKNLFQDGATDGDRFKQWARRNQVPTGCWYAAYPTLTTTHIRTNAAIRQGLATILTEEEAARWLSYFGSRQRPASAMEVHEIQSIVFGGLGFLRYGMATGIRLDGGTDMARAWLDDVRPLVAFGDGRKHGDRAVILSLSASGLNALRLPPDAMATFPPAFLQGMAAPSRARILGDEGASEPGHWTWGSAGHPVDGLLLLFAASESDLTRLRSELAQGLTTRGHRVVADVHFTTLPEPTASVEEKHKAKLEPFGFVDGVSQPAIRGTYKSLDAEAKDIVEPGEFILGYPNNHGKMPAAPQLAATDDPNNLLPIHVPPQHGFAAPIVNLPRDIGRNGTFLVARQLEQDDTGFWRYCEDAATRIKSLFPEWLDVRAEFVAAKLVGRWPDGSSLVRFPYRPASEDAKAERRVEVRETSDDTRTVSVEPDNDFLFGAEDPQGLRCPFGAHVRRTNPRESFDPGSKEQLSITNRHRILRVGRRYQPDAGCNPGILFMCLNADLERQFEFVQQTWAQSPSFHGLRHERDPLLGTRTAATSGQHDDGYTIPTRSGPVRLKQMPEFVTTLGGGYFFLPSRSFLAYLAARGAA